MGAIGWQARAWYDMMDGMDRRPAMLLFALGVSAGLLGQKLASSPPAAAESRCEPAAPRQDPDRARFGATVDYILNHYVDPPNALDLYDRALAEMTRGLDPHSHYLPAARRRALRARGSGGTAGLWVRLDPGPPATAEITAVAPEGPAARAGVVRGARVLAVDGVPVARMGSEAELRAMLGGRVGRHLRLDLRDPNGTTRRLDMRLAPGAGSLVRGELLPSDRGPAALVRIHAFRRGTGARVRATLARLRKRARAPLAAIVLDLRGNPGGVVDEALVVADLFRDSGVLTRTRGRDGAILREERAHASGSDTRTPLLILQDGATASAAELLAAALRDPGRARTVGTRTFGKGTVQEVRGLPGGGLLTLTVARYYSPSDRVIDGVGVPADIPARPDDPGIVRLALAGLRKPASP